jgi:hypothetical protein
MQYEALTAQEREIADKLCDDDRLRGRRVFHGLVYWAAKLGAIIDGNDPRAPCFYEALRNCLSCAATARALSKPHAHDSPDAFQAWRRARKHSMMWSTFSAHRAVDIAKLIQGMSIESRALVPLGTIGPERVLKAAYHALTAEIEPPSL